MNQLKMTNATDASESIVVSFEAKWDQPLRKNEVSVVFRKRGPRNFTPKYIYVYVGSPVCALTGRFAVEKCERLSTKDAVALADAGAIAADELERYARDYDHLYVFTVGDFESSKKELAYSDLSEKFGFSPPQSFFVLSKDGKSTVDKKAGFAKKA